MKNFNFIINRSPLSPEDIQSHKNFEKILHAYKSTPLKFYKSGWFKVGLASVAVVTTGTFLFFATTTNTNRSPDKKVTTVTSSGRYADESPCVKSKLQSIDVSSVKFSINPSRDTILDYNGSLIHYSANSLVYASGNNVSGNTVIRYREFHNAAQIFASGIPMKYDSAGAVYHLQSAGMIEIFAECNGTPVNVSSGKEIRIEMKTNQPNGSFNVYYLDTVKRNWNYLGKDERVAFHNAKYDNDDLKFKNKPVAITIDTNKLIVQNHILKPTRPKMVNPKAYSFTLDVLQDEFPELSIYDKSRFEVIDAKNSFTTQIYSTEWEDAELKEINKGEKYELTLTRGLIRKSFNITPVFEGENFKNAMNVYAKKYKEYNELLKGKIAEEKRKQQKELDEKSNWEKNAILNRKKHKAIENVSAKNSGLAARAFSVKKFGIVNCDNPEIAPKYNCVKAYFTDENGDFIGINQIWLCDLSTKKIYTYDFPDFKKFRFDSRDKNIVWGITREGKFAYSNVESLSKENINSNNISVKMNVYNDKLVDSKQVMDLLGI